MTSIDSISGCLALLQTAVFKLVDAIKVTASHDYESLLQDAEAKVRDHIRVTQSIS